MTELHHLGQWQIIFKVLSGVWLAEYSYSLGVDWSDGFLVAVFSQARVVERWNVTCLVPGFWFTGTTTFLATRADLRIRQGSGCQGAATEKCSAKGPTTQGKC